jgi:hypothetical protein
MRFEEDEFRHNDDSAERSAGLVPHGRSHSGIGGDARCPSSHNRQRGGTNEEEETMYKLKMLALAALAAATVGIGALAAAPSASAQRLVPESVCKALIEAADRYSLLAQSTPGGLWGWPVLHWYYVTKSAGFTNSWINAGCGS